MKKKTFLKSLSFTSLALLMGIAGTMAFAPLGASPSVAGASEMVDQINTKADGENIKYAPSALGLDPENDPVIYTTESGLKIKFGGAATALGGGNETTTISYDSLASGKPLSGYPYFTMGTYSGYAVNWVIIGKSTTMPTTTSMSWDYDILANWQSNHGSETYKNFFEQTYETTTPAGSKINNEILNDYAARRLEYIFNSSNFSSVVPNDEIPSGYVLALCEYSFTNLDYGGNNKYSGSAYYSYCENLPTTIGIGSEFNYKLHKPTIYSYGNAGTSSTSQYFFPLAYKQGGSEEFLVTTYLPDSTPTLRIAYKIGTTTAVSWMTRSGQNAGSGDRVWYINTGGTWGCDGNPVNTSSFYVRPACVISLA